MSTLAKVLLVFTKICLLFYFDLEDLNVFLSSLIWKFYYKYSLYFKFLHFPSPCSEGKLALHQRPQRPLHAIPRKANFLSSKKNSREEMKLFARNLELNLFHF